MIVISGGNPGVRLGMPLIATGPLLLNLLLARASMTLSVILSPWTLWPTLSLYIKRSTGHLPNWWCLPDDLGLLSDQLATFPPSHLIIGRWLWPPRVPETLHPFRWGRFLLYLLQSALLGVLVSPHCCCHSSLLIIITVQGRSRVTETRGGTRTGVQGFPRIPTALTTVISCSISILRSWPQIRGGLLGTLASMITWISIQRILSIKCERIIYCSSAVADNVRGLKPSTSYSGHSSSIRSVGSPLLE